MDKKSEKFIEECEKNNTTPAVFIRLFNMWTRLDSEQRGQVIETEIKKGRLSVTK